MRTNYVLIDYENVQPETLLGLHQEHFKVILFVGANQAKINFATVEALQRMGDRARYVKISGNGLNALDFHIAFYIGQIAAQDPSAYFHIISRDTGFDPLIEHLKARKIFARRSQAIADIPAVQAMSSPTPTDKLAAVIARLRQMGSKPGSVKTLASTINALFQKQLSDLELSALVKELQSKGIVSTAGTKLCYALPPA